MNPFRASQKTQDFKGQNPYLTEPSAGVCLQNTYDYSPFGVSLDGRTMEDGFYRRGFNGMEKDDEVKGEGNYFTTEFRQLDPRLGRWLSVDPMVHEREWMSPYNFVQNNPILRVDPIGALDNPIFDREGEFLGTDDKGLQGDAIVMKRDDFKQSMSHIDALSKKTDLNSSGAQKKVDNFMTTIKKRPDYDGKIILYEANKWYREGGGKPLFVDAAKVDLSPVEKSDFGKVGNSFYKNFEFTTNTETGLVYGNIKLTLINDKGVIKLGGEGRLLDKYDFDYKSGATNIPRNIATWFGEKTAGKGAGFSIFNYGTGTVK